MFDIDEVIVPNDAIYSLPPLLNQLLEKHPETNSFKFGQKYFPVQTSMKRFLKINV